MRGKEFGDIGMLKGVLLALQLCDKGLIIGGVVVPGSTVSLGVYRREEGEETINIKHRCNHDA